MRYDTLNDCPFRVGRTFLWPTRLRLLRSLEEVNALEDRWRQLDRHTPSPLLQFNWVRSCLASFAATDRPHVVAVSRDDRLVALAPLVSAGCAA